MSDNSKFRKPHVGDRIGMVLGNAIVAAIVLQLVFLFLGGNRIIEPPPAPGDIEWNPLLFLTPGAAIGFAWQRYTLIMSGRLRGVSWIAGAVQGVMISFANVPLAGLLLGILNENPLMGMLRGLVSLLVMPTLLVSMGAFGIIMGLYNSIKAEKWLIRK